MKFTALTPEDICVLDSDREFAVAVLESCHPGTCLTGTPADIELLQRILDGGPYTDSAEEELIALGTSFGDLLAQATGMQWVGCADEYGTTLCLRYEESSIVAFPREMLIKRIEKDEPIELQHLFGGVIAEVQRMIDSGEYGG